MTPSAEPRGRPASPNYSSRAVTEEQASPVVTAQPEADPPSAEMGLYLEEACLSSGETWYEEKREIIAKHPPRQRAFTPLCPLAPTLVPRFYSVCCFFLVR